jgi:hypothetical protein
LKMAIEIVDLPILNMAIYNGFTQFVNGK